MPTTTNVDTATSSRRPGERAAAALPRGAHLVGSVPLADAEEVFRLSEMGAVGLLWKRFWGHFGFWEAFKSPEEQASGRLLAPSEWTIDRLRKFHYVYAGSVSDVRKGMDTLVEAGNPEYFAWLSDQGMLPLEEVKKQLRTFGEQVLPHYRS